MEYVLTNGAKVVVKFARLDRETGNPVLLLWENTEDITKPLDLERAGTIFRCNTDVTELRFDDATDTSLPFIRFGYARKRDGKVSIELYPTPVTGVRHSIKDQAA